jgi:NADPH-dependent glutamate synthase beta subunit-like oxidoreductase
MKGPKCMAEPSVKVACTLDGRDIEFPAGTTILAAARSLGIEIPTLCEHKDLKPFSSCLLCVVELEGRPNLVSSCATLLMQGMKIHTRSERVVQARKMALDLLVSDHWGDCRGPCQSACPASCQIHGFVGRLAQGCNRDAIEVIKQDLAIPASLGRVCPRPCEEACRRNLKEGPVAICHLKRYAADVDLASAEPYVPAKQPASGKHIAVVGLGPAGISCAYHLLRRGHDVTVFDAHDKPGGMLRYGIPSYRLPRDVIDGEVRILELLGATFKYSTALGRDVTLAELRERYDSVFLAIGAQSATRLDIDGEDLPGVTSGLRFLEDVSAGMRPAVGRRVMVVGGGNTAIDAARTAIRLGARQVSILYRRTRKEMPAWDIEVHEAEQEGCSLEVLAAPVKIEQGASGLQVTCIRMELGQPDTSGRRRPVPQPGSEHIVECDEIIAAIGQSVNVLGIDGVGVKMSPWGTLVVDQRTLETSLQGVFAGGDCVLGPDIAVRAVGMGQKAAISIDQCVRGQLVVGERVRFNSTMGQLSDIPKAVTEHLPTLDRHPMPTVELARRVASFDEVETGYAAGQARAEAERCLQCGCGAADDCALRDYATEYKASQSVFCDAARRDYAIDTTHPLVNYESGKCIQCGTCVRLLEEQFDDHSLGFANRGFSACVKPPFGKHLGEFLRDPQRSLAIVQACPTGALVRKPESTRLAAE